MQKKELLSETTQSILTILSSSIILFAFAAGNTILALFAIVSMVVLKFHAVKYRNKKLDKFYLFMFSWAALMLIVLEILYRI
tara:strand:- start:178 stop:423 length:246 start_codon:yes stop_codon:yes gene_type:complete